MSSYLKKIGAQFYFRIVVPSPLRAKIGRREFKKLLSATSLSLAEKEAYVYAMRSKELFDHLQEKTMSHFPFTTIKLQDVKVGGVSIGNIELDPDKPEQELKLYNAVMDRLHADAEKCNTSMPVQAVSELQSPPPAPVPPVAQVTNNDLYLSEALNKFITYKQKRVEKRPGGKGRFDERAMRDPFKLLEQFLGADLLISEISNDRAEEFSELLKMVPRNRTDKIRSRLTFTQLIDLKEPVKISENTHGQHIHKISGMWHWLNKSGESNCANPFFGIADVKIMKRENPIKARMAFNNDDLTNIFKHEIFTEQRVKEDWEYWLPILLLYSGARVTEILQLEKRDILLGEEGIYNFWVNDIPTPDEPTQLWVKG